MLQGASHSQYITSQQEQHHVNSVNKTAVSF